MAKTEEAWFVVRTNIRCERRAARSLRAAGYRVYSPTFRKSVIHRRTKKRIIRRYSLMPGYIFVRMTRLSRDGRPDWFALRGCDGVEAVLGIKGEPLAVPRQDVILMMQAQRSHKFDNVYVEKVPARKRRKELEEIYKRGRYIRAKEGAFTGMYLTVESVTAQGRILAMLEVFGRLTPVEIDVEHIEPLDTALAA